LKSTPSDAPITFLEPAAGTGAFFSALLLNTSEKQISSAVGCEIDPIYGNIANSIWKPSGFQLVPCDFIEFASDPHNFGKFTLLCTNPPYVRHHHLPSEQKSKLQSLVMQRLGSQPSGLSGLYVYFMLLADKLLADGAISSWLLPAEFLYVNYGRVLRDYLTSRVTLLSIHHFDPDEVQFDDALVSSCVVTYCKKPPSNEATCEMSFGGTFVASRLKKTMPISQLRTLNKWTMPHFEPSSAPTNGIRLKEIVSVRRGIATGANDFFIINEDTAHKYDIPSKYLKPILPSPRLVHDSVIESNLDGTPKVEGFRYLLDCTSSPDEVRRLHPGLWTYLEEGIAKGLPERYLCAQRAVWYFQEKREPSLFLASYMGRSTETRTCPIRFFLNFSSALVTNVFLNLYPTTELANIIGDNHERMIELVNSLNAIPSNSVLQAGRAYGGGLHKIEPKELLELPFSTIPSWLEVGLKRQLILI